MTRLPPLTQEGKAPERPRTPTDDPPPYSPLTPISRRTPPPAPRMSHATLHHRPDRSPQPPPPYEATISTSSEEGWISVLDLHSSSQRLQDVVHYLSPDDSFQSMSLAYRVPAHILKAHNNVPNNADHLLSARRSIKIPASHYQGPSLSPSPLENPEEQERKSKIRKLMVHCKVSEYQVAVLYLQEAGWDLEKAEAKVEEDDSWEREHPISGSSLDSTMVTNPLGRRLRLAAPLSPRRIANLLS